MKISSHGRTEIIEQANRKIWHMWFDFVINKYWLDFEWDLSLPVNSGRKYSMMTALNEELFNAADAFLSDVTLLYDGDKNELNADALYTVVTSVFHDAINRLNDKWEPLFNVFVKDSHKSKKKEKVEEEKESLNTEEEQKETKNIVEEKTKTQETTRQKKYHDFDTSISDMDYMRPSGWFNVQF